LVQEGFRQQESLKNKLIFPPVFLPFVENSNSMTALQKAEALLPEMSRGEKAQLMKLPVPSFHSNNRIMN